jgi:hypothetical protein
MKLLALLLAVCATTLNALWPMISDANAVSIPDDICSAHRLARDPRGENSGDEPNRSHTLLFGVSPPVRRLAVGTGPTQHPDHEAR